jgi:hypothetical protein
MCDWSILGLLGGIDWGFSGYFGSITELRANKRIEFLQNLKIPQ